jgi:hypothetical protein
MSLAGLTTQVLMMQLKLKPCQIFYIRRKNLTANVVNTETRNVKHLQNLFLSKILLRCLSNTIFHSTILTNRYSKSQYFGKEPKWKKFKKKMI